MNNPIDPTTPLAVTLQAQEWNQVLFVLNDAAGPGISHRVVAPLMQRIAEQVQTAAGQAPAPAPALNGNGVDHAPN